jgi:hypothetical protein
MFDTTDSMERGTMRARTMGVVAMVIGALLLSLSAPAFAEDDPAGGTPEATPTVNFPAFVLSPTDTTPQENGYLSIEIEPGGSQEVAVVFGLTVGDKQEVSVYKADVFTAPNGGFGARNLGDPATGPTTWLDFETTTHTFAVGEGIERTFTIAVPSDTAPGEYVTSLVIQNAEPLPIPNSQMFDQTIRLALPVLITVPGPLQDDVELGDPTLVVDIDALRLVVPITNSGNTIVKPMGAIVLTDPDSGDVLITAPVEMGSVYAGHETTIEIVIRNDLRPGDVNLDVAVDAGDAHAERNDVALVAPDLEAPIAQAPVRIDAMSVEPVPSGDNIQFLNLSASIGNSGEPVANARLIFHVTRDGEMVEDFALASSLSLPNGATDVRQRYIPVTGWEPGVYAFALTLESVDPANGVATVIEHLELPETVAVS